MYAHSHYLLVVPPCLDLVGKSTNEVIPWLLVLPPSWRSRGGASTASREEDHHTSKDQKTQERCKNALSAVFPHDKCSFTVVFQTKRRLPPNRQHVSAQSFLRGGLFGTIQARWCSRFLGSGLTACSQTTTGDPLREGCCRRFYKPLRPPVTSRFGFTPPMSCATSWASEAVTTTDHPVQHHMASCQPRRTIDFVTEKKASEATSGPDNATQMKQRCSADRKRSDPPLPDSALPDGMLLLLFDRRVLAKAPGCSPRFDRNSTRQ